MSTKIINISLPSDLVEEMDKEAKRQFANRSDFIRQTLADRLAVRLELRRIHQSVARGAKKAGINTPKDIEQAIREVHRDK